LKGCIAILVLSWLSAPVANFPMWGIIGQGFDAGDDEKPKNRSILAIIRPKSQIYNRGHVGILSIKNFILMKKIILHL
jgi:hypothetical protein